MIPLMKNTFLNEIETKKALSEFITTTSRLSMDQQCASFEKTFSKFQNSKYGILFNSGGSANLAMLQALKNLGHLKNGDHIGFSGLTWSTNVMPILQLGFIPVAIDCSPQTLNVMSSDLLKSIKGCELKALFITNALGFAGDLCSIKDICDENGIILIEDNCESLGTELNGKKTGTFGKMASFSFFVAHHMSTIEGGMVCTDDGSLAEMLCIVRANGWGRNLSSIQQQKWRKRYDINSEFRAKYTFYDLGFNLRPTEITGFLGLYQMKYLEENIVIREKNYLNLEPLIMQNPDLNVLERGHLSKLSSFAIPILTKSPELAEEYVSHFAGAGVEVRPMIAGNLQKQPFYSKYVSKTVNLPGTDQIDQCGFYCGNYPELSENDLEIISSCLTKY